MVRVLFGYAARFVGQVYGAKAEEIATVIGLGMSVHIPIINLMLKTK